MAKKIYDVIVIGTGAGGGMAIKTLCEAGLKVCALNAGQRLDPEKDFRYHRMPWDMKFRGMDDPKRRGESFGYMDNEYTKAAWDHEIPFTTPPGMKWMWPRCKAVGGRRRISGDAVRRASATLISARHRSMVMTSTGRSLMTRSARSTRESKR